LSAIEAFAVDIGTGTRLEQYEIVRWLDRGGMGDVYVGKHALLGVERAVKVIRPELAGQPEFRRRFAEEARALGRLDHPNILGLLDYGETGGIAYLVMELVPGGSLAQRTSRTWKVEEVVPALQPIAAALDYAHAQKIVHGDVKPSNILRRSDGTLVLADFGIFRDLAATLVPGQSDEIEGAPYYMATERAAGRPSVEASDQYALACVAFELLTGQVPFNGSSPLAVLNAHISAPPPSARAINPALSPATDKALMRALAKSPDDRYPSAEAFIAALAANQPTLRFGARLKFVAMLGIAVIAAGAIALAGATEGPLAFGQASPTMTPAAQRPPEQAPTMEEARLPLVSLPATPTPPLPTSNNPVALAPAAAPPPATDTTTPTFSPSPTSTASHTPTASPSATPNLSPTSTPTDTSRPTTVTPLPSAPPTLSATAATAARTYPPPVLAPATSTGGSIILRWTYGAALANDEWFDVRVWKDGQPAYGIANVKSTTYEIGGNFPAGVYNWTIAVIRKSGNGSIETLTVAEQKLRFNWAPPGPSSECPAYPNCG
jgi:serine/threonine-protein kinase